MEGLFLLVIILLVIYFIPTFIGFSKGKKNKGAIFALNLLLGWSVIGWVISFVWALTND